MRLDVLAAEFAEERLEVELAALAREAVNALRVSCKGRAALKSQVVSVAARPLQHPGVAAGFVLLLFDLQVVSATPR